MNSSLTNLAANGRRTDILERVESPAAALTLTRSATLAITTAATIITWQTELRNNGFTWSGTNITIPTTGFYNIAFHYFATVAVTTYTRINVNSIWVVEMPASPGNRSRPAVTYTRYFTTGDIITIQVDTTANHTMAVNAENTANESPFLHIVQLTGGL
ncbi:hypothetical protein UFOVP1188_16 [uncultured Caudovirales phage]|uniref:Uncharacterized protein n=1 Tax=uncultured Caudovirales phage TaxID=2100421 RepID=A0A6J7XLF7_9CAUD|nr:hypothetical protein UFOVP1029_16 [uncultured Caudovirales phage]CAB4185087.1 hypothetical protein UFOVP1129_16 [uncultured Caudovirales phage]CAB4189345.1 hypothetical protein UFOVP1188_16 [uncultured Caudovirales phage]CAB4217464.1 hypothetical protein UFOVP1490_31 [uncultured Caudovirales phage]CAB4220391.1 hypothetical protein UFOVP1633_16 [uncultured Caudovirales phage]